MEIGVQMIFQSYGYDDSVTDAQVYDEEIRLAMLAEELGFDAIWPVEHHFEDYSYCPDNTEFLAYMAAKTERIKLATGAVIMPWNTPLRVAEKISLLDTLSKGRVIFGMGRGLSRREYEQFGIDQEESRDRFDESSQMVLEALESGVIEGDGKYYKQPKAPIRPRPFKTFKGRTTSVAMSPDSVEQCARIGARMVIFSQRSYEEQREEINKYREAYRRYHNTQAPPPMICDFMYIHEDEEKAREGAEEYIGGYLASVMHHYELGGDHYKKLKGYEQYGSNVDAIKAIGLEGMLKGYLDVQAWGTPKQVIEKFEERREYLGDFHVTTCFRYAGMPYEECERNMRLYAETVIPHLRKWETTREAAE